MKTKIVNKLKFMALGGVDDINRNCYVIEYGKDIVVMDMGFSFPDDSLYGVDYLIPDVEYLRRRKERIAGIVLSHAHMDHIGAIPYVIEKLGFPMIYGRQFTILLLKEKLKEFGLENKVKTKIVKENEDIHLRSMTARLIPVTHSIPQSSSILVKTPGGNIIYSGDFKFDDNPVNEAKPNYETYEKIGKEGIDLACIDSTNIYLEGKSKSETEIAGILDRIVKNAKGRVIASTFSSLGTRLYSLIEIAKKYNRKVAVTGRSMKNMLVLLRQIGYIKAGDNLFISDKSVKSVPDEKLLILTTGTQGEEMAALSRIARNEHNDIKIKETDTVVLSSSVIPGNQVMVQHLIDDLIKLGARVIHQSFMDVHTSGHGYQEDIKKMLQLVKPKYAMPVHGWPSFIHEAAFQYNRWGMKRKNILIPETGRFFIKEEKDGRWIKTDKIECKDVCVEGISITDAGKALIEERAQLANFGVLLLSFQLDKGGRIIGEVRVNARGFVYLHENVVLIKKIQNNVNEVVAEWRKIDKRSIKKLKIVISKSISKLVDREVNKKPVITIEVFD